MPNNENEFQPVEQNVEIKQSENKRSIEATIVKSKVYNGPNTETEISELGKSLFTSPAIDHSLKLTDFKPNYTTIIPVDYEFVSEEARELYNGVLEYSHDGDSGIDVRAVKDFIIEPGERVKIPTGLRFDIPLGLEIQNRPRSGVSLDTTITVHIGTVDSPYVGEVGIIVENNAHAYRTLGQHRGSIPSLLFKRIAKLITGKEEETTKLHLAGTIHVKKGDRIAQIVFAPVIKAILNETKITKVTSRGYGGFNSTGTK